MVKAFPWLVKGLKLFNEIHGHTRVPVSYVIDPTSNAKWPVEMAGIKLGQYVSRARNFKRQNKLKKRQIESLNRIGMLWYAFADDFQLLVETLEIG